MIARTDTRTYEELQSLAHDQANQLAAVTAQRDGLLAACKAIVDRYRLYDGKFWICRYCGMFSRQVESIPHRDDCEVLMAEAAIASVEGK